MGDLHSIAYSSLHNYSPMPWDLHSPNPGAFNSDISQFWESSESCTPPLLSQFESDFSTGYLQDALFEFNSKRRRLEFKSSQISMTCFENCEDSAASSGEQGSDAENKETLGPLAPLLPPAGEGSEKRKKRNLMSKIVYPFEVVKPGGREGEVTLHEINERILMPPTRPVRHPVGDFACRSLISPNGPGLSGKAVVALTRIHTQGRGTITIIRTKD